MPIHYGETVAHLRGRITQKEVAAKLKIKQQQYARIEKRKEINDTLLIQIGAAIGYSLEQIKNYSLKKESIIQLNVKDTELTILYQNLIKEKERTIEVLLETIKHKDIVIETLKTVCNKLSR